MDITKVKYDTIINIFKYNSYILDAYEWLINHIEHLIPLDNLILSALGARICYASTHPLNLFFKDKRISDIDERVNFLSRIFRRKHYSVFAHSPIFLDTSTLDSLFNFSSLNKLFKLWTYFDLNTKNTYYCLNARHLFEALSNFEIDFYNIVHKFLIKDGRNNIEIFTKILWIGEDVNINLKSSYLGYGEIAINNGKVNFNKFGKGILCFVLDKSPWQWFSFIVYGYSRIFSHQLVRHTWLNFSQRSHRYTKVDDIVIPYKINSKKKCRGLVTKTIDNNFVVYNTLINNGIKREDARFIMPAGSSTTIMASGPRFVWEDFVNKRLNDKSQWEIRKFAQYVSYVLNMVN